MDLLLEIRDEDLKQKAAGLNGNPGYDTLLEMLVETQRERDAEAKKSPVQRRRSEIKREIKETAFEEDDRHHIHSVLALCGLPYRQPSAGARQYQREYGRNSLVVQAGFLKDPVSGKMAPQGLPYGPKARLLLLHICTMAIRQRSAEIAIADSMSAFIRDLDFAVTGGSRGTITQFKEQLNRLAAAHMQIGLWNGDRSMTLNAQPIKSFEIWLPQDPDQRVLWSSTLRLDHEFYESLRVHALPIDIRALRAFSQSAKQIDVVLWLAYRLRNVVRPYPISLEKLREQFGADVTRLRKFREEFAKDLELIREVFPDLPVRLTEEGILLAPCEPDRLFVQRRREQHFLGSPAPSKQ
jgi:hypothetical protein